MKVVYILQDLKNHIVLVMELCDYDLDKLVKTSPFREDDITLFLYQLGEYGGMGLGCSDTG